VCISAAGTSLSLRIWLPIEVGFPCAMGGRVCSM
jgi:hypothetical protein